MLGARKGARLWSSQGTQVDSICNTYYVYIYVYIYTYIYIYICVCMYVCIR